MKARETCKSVTKKIAIASRCNFFLHGMSCIAHDCEVLGRLIKTHDYLALYSTFNSNIEFDDVFVHVRKNASVELRLIQKFITLRSPPRILVLVDNAHAPTLKLLRAMGMVFYCFTA